ncbi:MAG: dihydroorotate dehydrogenase electron transfer subunit [Pelotomaculum sp.]
MPSILEAEVVNNECIVPDHYRLTLLAPSIARQAVPGQFLHLRCWENYDPLLRRPISIHAVDRQSGVIVLLYRIMGRGTGLLSQQKPGATLNVIGPLGRGFTLPQRDNGISVVAGGIGIAPLYFLLQELSLNGIKATVFQGAATANMLLITREISALGHELFVATDDGSAGFHGTVIDLLASVSMQQDIPISFIYTCGPRAMMQKVSEFAAQQGAACEVSLEERMGCGVGACLSCACKIKGQGTGFSYQRVCVEGPVFSGEEVSWD